MPSLDHVGSRLVRRLTYDGDVRVADLGDIGTAPFKGRRLNWKRSGSAMGRVALRARITIVAAARISIAFAARIARRLLRRVGPRRACAKHRGERHA